MLRIDRQNSIPYLVASQRQMQQICSQAGKKVAGAPIRCAQHVINTCQLEAAAAAAASIASCCCAASCCGGAAEVQRSLSGMWHAAHGHLGRGA